MPILEWLNKNEAVKTVDRVPYRLLKANLELSYGEQSENMIIKGDNLEALKALLPYYKGQVKCIYIDPPYNSCKADDILYDDNIEHSQWLTIMYPRIELLRDLLKEDGVIFVQLDDDEMAYMKVMLDEVFGRNNFINQVSVKMKQTAGASGGGEDKKLKKNIEYILIYAKNYSRFEAFNNVEEKENLFDLIDEMESTGKSWKYTSILQGVGDFVEERTIYDGTGDPITVKKYKGLKRTTVSKLINDETNRETVYINNFENIFSDTNAQTSIRTRVIDEFEKLEQDECLVVSYIPKSGKDKGNMVEHYYISPTIRRVIWLKDSAEKSKNLIYKKEKVGTYWDGFPLNNLTKEGNVRFPNGKKPEALLQRVLELITSEGDLVLDSFLGSATTAAVAHKMGRKYIGIEMGEHAITHCVPRLKAVIDGEQGGISKMLNWQGGGGFTFYDLAETVFDEDGNINKQVDFKTLASHIWFVETKTPLVNFEKSTLIGVFENTAYYLLYNGILGDKKVDGGNVLTQKIFDTLPNFEGKKVIYGEATRMNPAKLKSLNITFKQTPYDVKAR